MQIVTDPLDGCSIHNRFGLDGEEIETVCELRGLALRRTYGKLFDGFPLLRRLHTLKFRAKALSLRDHSYRSIEFISGAKVNWREVSELQ